MPDLSSIQQRVLDAVAEQGPPPEPSDPEAAAPTLEDLAARIEALEETAATKEQP